MPQPLESLNLIQKRRLRWLTVITALEAALTLIALFSIPPDPKNAFLFGLSWKRWLIILASFLLGLRAVVWRFQPQSLYRYAQKYLRDEKTQRFIDISAIISGILLWLALCFPAQRLGLLADDYARVRPLLLLFFLASFQLILVLQTLTLSFQPAALLSGLKAKRKLLWIAGAGIVLSIGVFMALHFLAVKITSPQALYFPASSILTPLQVFSAWVIFCLLRMAAPNGKHKWFQHRSWQVFAFLFLWLLTFLIWNGTPLPCTGDRPAAAPPNYVCYPPIDDSVYSIGSLYIGLGEGVYNHWLTDKPLYLVFLAAGQALFGANIDHYIVFQVLILACLPALIYYFSRRMLRFSGGLLAAGLMILKGYNEIRLYSSVGGMNVKIENTEGLMTLLLILLAITAVAWFKKPGQAARAVIAGGVLGLCVLVRFNPLAILPLILAAYLWINRKNWRKATFSVCLFMASFLLTVLPWFITARDENGVSFYYQKIRDVIDLRFSNPSAWQPQTSAGHLASPALDLLAEQNSNSNQAANFALHFLNNQFQSLAELPINFSFSAGETLGQQAYWQERPFKPIWLLHLSAENTLALVMNLLLVCLGLAILLKKQGWIGLLPLMIQTGYFLGNAAAMTSGERYLMPVGWVTLLYYCVGLLWIVFSLAAMLKPKNAIPLFEGEEFAPEQEQALPLRKAKGLTAGAGLIAGAGLTAGAGLAFFLLLGSLPYLADFLPEKLPAARSPELNQEVHQLLTGSGIASEEQWNRFISEPNALVVRAKAYHAKYYRNPAYYPGQILFELMALGNDYVYVSHMPGVEPTITLSDGSDIILIGCKVNEDEIWNAKRIFMNTRILLQTSSEKNTVIHPNFGWNCP